MKLWDTSALLALLLGEDDAGGLRGIASADPSNALWWGTKVEALSGVCRRRRVGGIPDGRLPQLVAAIERAVGAAYEVHPIEEVRDTACRLLRVHDLRAGDALQLAAALVWCGHSPSGHGFVCLDARLRRAAEREGFDVLPS